MYKISFKGALEPEYIPEDANGKELYDGFLKGTLPRRIELTEGRAFEASSIKAIESGYTSPNSRAGWTAPVFAREEIRKLKAELDAYPQKKVDGRYLTKQELYCIAKGILENRDGEMVVKDANALKIMDAMFDEVDKYEYGLSRRDEQLEGKEYTRTKRLMQFKDFRPSSLEGHMSPAHQTEERKCVKCGENLAAWLKKYCSGACLNEAKIDGTYKTETEGIPTVATPH